LVALVIAAAEPAPVRKLPLPEPTLELDDEDEPLAKAGAAMTVAKSRPRANLRMISPPRINSGYALPSRPERAILVLA
jgi:hypothetical protein